MLVLYLNRRPQTPEEIIEVNRIVIDSVLRIPMVTDEMNEILPREAAKDSVRLARMIHPEVFANGN